MGNDNIAINSSEHVDAIAWDKKGQFTDISKFTIPVNSEYGRYSEGSFLSLGDSSILVVYTRFDNAREDYASASIVARRSYDRGQTWSDESVVVSNTDDVLNVMSASLTRLQNGNIGLFYLIKRTMTDCYPVVQISNDNGMTFGEPIMIIEPGVGYFTLNNSRVEKLSCGRFIAPLSEYDNDGVRVTSSKGKMFYMYSDDNGTTWEKSGYLNPCADDVIEQEPGIVELNDGSLLCYVRTDKGSQFFARSYDNGTSWSDFKESSLTSPLSPATIIQIQTGKKPLMAVWNNSSYERRPLTIALSYDGGSTWANARDITDAYASYPSLLIFDDGEILIGYCYSDTFSYGLENYSIDRFKYIELEPGE